MLNNLYLILLSLVHNFQIYSLIITHLNFQIISKYLITYLLHRYR